MTSVLASRRGVRWTDREIIRVRARLIEKERRGEKTREMKSDKQIRMCILGGQASCLCVEKTDCDRVEEEGDEALKGTVLIRGAKK